MLGDIADLIKSIVKLAWLALIIVLIAYYLTYKDDSLGLVDKVGWIAEKIVDAVKWLFNQS